jgi:hypothetical protein
VNPVSPEDAVEELLGDETEGDAGDRPVVAAAGGEATG